MQQGTTPADYLRGGIVAQQLWVAAERLGFAVHPMTPTFLYAGDDATARTLSSNHGDELAALREAGVGHVAVAGKAAEIASADSAIATGDDVIAFLTDLLDAMGVSR